MFQPPGQYGHPQMIGIPHMQMRAPSPVHMGMITPVGGQPQMMGGQHSANPMMFKQIYSSTSSTGTAPPPVNNNTVPGASESDPSELS